MEQDMRLFFSFFVILLVGVGSQAYAAPQIHCDGQENNLAIYLEINRVLFNERDTTRVEEFYADEFISHELDGGVVGGPGAQTVLPELPTVVTPEFMKQMWEESKKNDPTRVLEDELILCVGDFVVVRTTMSGKNNGPLLGHAPTGKPYSIKATDILRFEDGKVVERWGNADLWVLFKQLGFQLEMVSDESK
jgi:hypothetical protein